VPQVPPIVHDVLRSPGQPLDGETRAFMEPRFGWDFSRVRVHTDALAGESARAVGALAYTVGNDVAFARGEFAPRSPAGRRLLAHELVHVAQQGAVPAGGGLTVGSPNSEAEQTAERESDAVVSGRAPRPIGATAPALARRAAPFIKKVSVHLTPPQSADLDWEGAVPADATGEDHFIVSSGKGYSDPGDDPGTCSRSCCTDPLKQCAPPWNQPGRVGACCTYHGSGFWTGTPLREHNGWNWWTPIQPHYSSRGIALHQHDEVTGEPIGHGCVRMDGPNAKRIFDFSNGRRTEVSIDGRAAPVLCTDAQRCGASSVSPPGGGAAEEAATAGEGIGGETQPVTPGLEGVMS
jgi:hypothetical protein